MSIKNISGGAVAERSSPSRTFEGNKATRGWHDFAVRDVITHADVLNNGMLTAEVRIMPEEGDFSQHFIPKNNFMEHMMHLFPDEETADMSFKVEFRPLLDASKDSVHQGIVWYSWLEGLL